MHVPIAVVGMGAIFPGAMDLCEYWSNILAGKDEITDVPESYWKMEDYYDKDPHAKDKCYGNKGGFVGNIPFDAMAFGISPKTMESISVEQLFALVVAKQALTDAEMLGKDAKPFDHEKAGVILAAGVGKTAFSLNQRLQVPKIRKILKNSGVPEQLIEHVLERIGDAEVEWNEACNPGYLGNVVAGRIANRFDLYGTNCIVDAACASSLAALKYAVSELESGDCDVMLTGGVNLDCSEFSFVSFCKTPAISKTGHIKPFDKDSDGMILGDGVGMLVLKRLSDAKRDGNKIYGVIRGIGSSGDGKAKSIFAPRKEGQKRALIRAYENADVNPASITLIEAHGTGTAKGDECEIEALSEFFSENGVSKHEIGLGSVKSQIGHTRLTAGVASLIKTLMALHHKILPATINVENPNEKLKESPLEVLTKAKPWIVNAKHPVRRAGVSAFGFGGTNFHVVVEEYQTEGKQQPYRLHQTPHMVIISGASVESLKINCEKLLQALMQDERAYLADIYSAKQLEEKEVRLGFVARDGKDAREKLQVALEELGQNSLVNWEKNGICYRMQGMHQGEKIVTLFSGQGGQYTQMFRETAMNYPELQEMFEIVDNAMLSEGEIPISDVVYPFSAYKEEEKVAENNLMQTKFTQPALAAVCGGVYKLLKQRGYTSDFAIGHSFGELTALWANGVMSDETYAHLAVKRGYFMGQPIEDATGMMAVAAPRDEVEKYIEGFDKLYMANENSNQQNIVSGDMVQLDLLAEALQAKNITAKKLRVSSAFHSPYMEKAKEAFKTEIHSAPFNDLQGTIIANATHGEYPKEATQIKALLEEQITNPVYFRTCIEKAYAEGARIFVEIGPGKVLSGLLKHILGERPYEIITVNADRKTGDLYQLEMACMKLKTIGLAIQADPYEMSVNPEIKLKATKSSYEVPPTFFRTPDKKKRVDEAIYKVDAPLALEVTPVEEAKGNNQNYVREEGNVIVEKHLDVEAACTLQSINQQALSQFLKSQGEQLETIQNLMKVPAQTGENLQHYIDFVAAFQNNSMKAYETYFNEQQKVLTGANVNNAVTYVAVQPQESTAIEVNRQEEPTQLNIPVTQVTKEADLAPEDAQKIASQAAVDIMTLLKQIISEKTGYPEEMIEEEMELEADLGIDSIKRVEIFSALNEALHIEADAQVAEGLSTLYTLKEIGNYLQAQVHHIGGVSATLPQIQTNEVHTVSSAKVVNSNKLKALLINIISEKTGYPEEMIEGDMDLEADLGIDSIKRVEIFSALNEALESTFDQEAVEVLSTCYTINEITHFIEKQAAPQITSEGIGTVEDGSNSATSSLATDTQDKADLQKILIGIISEKTGYPEEMIEENMDLEADLGIDSIKRVEIFSDLGTQLGGEFSQEDVEGLSTCYTVAEIVNYLCQKVSKEDEVTKGRHASTSIKDVDIKNTNGIKRYEVAYKHVALSKAISIVNKGMVLLTNDNRGVAKEVGKALQDKGFTPVVLNISASEADQVSEFRNFTLESVTEEDVEKVLKEITGATKIPLTGFMHISKTVENEENIQSLFNHEEQEVSKAIFLIAKYFKQYADLSTGEGKSFFINVLRMDGFLGNREFNGNMYQGSLLGLTKTLAKEWPDTFVRAIDIHSNCSTHETVKFILEELASGDTEYVEIGRDERGVRGTLELKEKYEEIPAEKTPTPDDVFLVTGGARGVTAQCVIALAKKYQSKIILLGRSELKDDIIFAKDVQSKEELQQLILRNAKAEGKVLKPKEVNAAVKRLYSQLEVRRTIEAIQNVGSQVLYIPCDVKDSESVKLAIRQGEEAFGKITGLIHGAGLLADKYIEKKTATDFENIVGTKVWGLENCLNNLNLDKLKYTVLYSSIAAYFGNPGQADYAMGNEALNKFAYAFKKLYPKKMVMAINWGPWDGGMVDQTLKNAFLKNGIAVIPMETGINYFIDQFEYAHANEVCQIVIHSDSEMNA